MIVKLSGQLSLCASCAAVALLTPKDKKADGLDFGIFFDGKGLVTAIGGTLDKHLLDVVNRDLWSHPAWDTARYVLVDMRSVNRIKLDDNTVQFQAAASNVASLSGGRSRIGLVIQNEELRLFAEAFCRGLNELCEGRIFDDVAPAYEWLRDAPRNGWRPIARRD